MLVLKLDQEIIQHVNEGSSFRLLNGDVVSPAYVGWEDNGYRLEQAPDPTPDEIRALQEAARKAAYQSEADPIFFMTQRGEATIEEWQAKVAEIKARFPYPQA